MDWCPINLTTLVLQTLFWVMTVRISSDFRASAENFSQCIIIFCVYFMFHVQFWKNNLKFTTQYTISCIFTWKKSAEEALNILKPGAFDFIHPYMSLIWDMAVSRRDVFPVNHYIHILISQWISQWSFPHKWDLRLVIKWRPI